MKRILASTFVMAFASASFSQVFEPLKKADESDALAKRNSFTLQYSTFDWDTDFSGFDGKPSFLATIDFDLKNGWSAGAWTSQDRQELNVFGSDTIETAWYEIHATKTFELATPYTTVGAQVGLLSADLDVSGFDRDTWLTVGAVGSTALDRTEGVEPKLYLGGHISYGLSIEGDDFDSGDGSLFLGENALTYGLSLSYQFSETMSVVTSYWVFNPESGDGEIIDSIDRWSIGVGFKF